MRSKLEGSAHRPGPARSIRRQSCESALIEDLQQALASGRNSQSVDITVQLNNLLALPPGTIYELVEPLPPELPVQSAEEAVCLPLNSNPQVIEAQATVNKARAGLQVAKADFLPDITVFGSYFNQTIASAVQPNFGAVGLAASYTFVDWGKRRRVRDQRETLISQAQWNVRATIDKVRLETTQAFNGYTQAQQSLALATEMLTARTDAEKEAKDPAVAQAAKAATAKAGLDLIQDEIAYRVAHAKLVGAMGCG